MVREPGQVETDFNRRAWDAVADSAARWFRPVTEKQVVAAREGDWSVQVTATRSVDRDWLGDVGGRDILCLAGGGGQQGPILAAAGGRVTVADFSPSQLALDRQLAERFRLPLTCLQTDMRNLAALADASFDIVLNPCSLNYCPEVQPVWNECHRVLRSGGRLIAGLIQPLNYLFDPARLAAGDFVVTGSIPCCQMPESGAAGPVAIEFAHPLEDLLGGQLRAGFRLVGLQEDRWGGHDPLSQRIDLFLATCAVKPETAG